MEDERHAADPHFRGQRGAHVARLVGDVEITGHLELTLDDHATIDVTAHGSRVRAEIGDLGLHRPSLRLLRASAMLARRLSRLLHARTLTLTVTRFGEPLIDVGAGIRGGPLARLLGFSRVRVYWRR